MLIGKIIQQKDDLLTPIEPEQLFSRIKQPAEETASLITRLRLVKTIDAKQYSLLKRQLPYIVCGVFSPPFRRTENFGYIDYFMVDIDHIGEKGLDIELLKAQLIADSRVVMCFLSPSEDGLKVLFRLQEKCYDSGQYSTFYKLFVRALSLQYGLEQVVDTRTSDVSRACFLSHDPNAYFNTSAEVVKMTDFVDFNDPFAIKELMYDINIDEKEKNKTTEKPPKDEISDEALDFIKSKLGNRTVKRDKPKVYVPEELDAILSSLTYYVKESGVVIDEIENIHYGKKFKMHLGLKKSEVNLFFGKRGYSVVKSPKAGTHEPLNDLMTEYIKVFINDLYSDKIELSATESIRQQAAALQNDKKFAEAIPLFKALWEKYRFECNEWDGWRYAYCLKQEKNYKEALDICRETFLMKRDFAQLNNLYAWCIYYTEIAIPKITDEATFFKAAEGILRLCIQEDKFSPYTQTVFKVITYLTEKPKYPTDKMDTWISRLSPELLSSDTFSFTDNSGKQREMASQKEQYYAWRSKVLLEKGMWNECIKLSNKALSIFEKFHYNNDIWFSWRIALAHEGLGQKEVALELLKKLIVTKNEWFIQKEIAAILFTQGKVAEALQYAIDGVLNNGDADKKIMLFKLLVNILKAKNNMVEAKKLVEYIFLIKKINNQPIDYELQTLAQELQVNHAVQGELKTVGQEVRKMMETIKYGSKQQYTGIIKTILPNGKAGFVETEKGKSYYFLIRNVKGRREDIKQGLQVSFFLEEGFDVKKNKKTLNATHITKN